MKVRIVVLSCLAGAVVLCMGYQSSRAEMNVSKASLKIGVVSVRKIFQDCQRRKNHDKRMAAEEQRINAELNVLRKKIEADEARLDTLKRESSDYLKLERDVTKNRDDYQSQKAFSEKLLSLKDWQWMKEAYKDVLRITGEVAREKGLELVFERSEPDFSLSAAKLMLTTQTHKLLYCAGCLDITSEVISRLDAEGSKLGAASTN